MHDRMIGRIQMIRKRETALAMAIERIVAGRRNDPIAQIEQIKVHAHRFALANFATLALHVRLVLGASQPAVVQVFVAFLLFVGLRFVLCALSSLGVLRFAAEIAAFALFVVAVVGVCHQNRLLFGPFVDWLVRAAPQAYVLLCGRIVGMADSHLYQDTVVCLRVS